MRNVGPKRRLEPALMPALAKIVPPERALPPLRLIRTIIRNPIEGLAKARLRTTRFSLTCLRARDGFHHGTGPRPAGAGRKGRRVRQGSVLAACTQARAGRWNSHRRRGSVAMAE